MKLPNNIKTPLLLVAICLTFNNAQTHDAGLESIGGENLLQTVKILCSEEFDGRLPGGEGYTKAAKFAADKFRHMELIPAGDDEYFQYLNVEYNKIDTPIVFKMITNEKSITYLHGEDFVLRGFTGSGEIFAQVVFCGYGISRPDLGYDDYENVDVKDKIVMVFKQNPSWKINDSTWGNEYPREKSRVAYEQGAKGILFVSRPNDEKPQPLIGSVMHGEGEQITDFPQLQISIDVANDLFSGTGYSLNGCQSNIDECKAPHSLITENEVEIKVQTEYKTFAKTMNVIGLLKGSDPVLKDEYLIIGAHLDHVGSQAGLFFPGANDNASGSAAVLELAEAFQKSELKPRRSILFVLFTAEEQGLFGSRFFVENLNIDTNKIIAMFNLDSVGSGDSIQVGNGKSSPVLWNLARKIDKENLNLVVKDTWSGGGADLTPFYEIGIPGLYFVSKYSYEHLHLPTDTPETLNQNLFESIIRLAYLTAREIADGNYKREEVIK
jgi:hypothetical protein